MKIKKALINQKDGHLNNLYDWTQVYFAYHSNRIEGNPLSLQQDRYESICKQLLDYNL